MAEDALEVFVIHTGSVLFSKSIATFGRALKKGSIAFYLALIARVEEGGKVSGNYNASLTQSTNFDSDRTALSSFLSMRADGSAVKSSG